MTDIPVSRQSLWLQALRWLLTLPAAILGSILAYWVVRLFMWLGSSRFGDESWLEYFLREILASGAMGAAFVYCPALVAPRYKKATAIAAAGVVLSLSGLMLLTALSTRAYMSLLATVCLNLGAIITAVSIFSGETEVD